MHILSISLSSFYLCPSILTHPSICPSIHFFTYLAKPFLLFYLLSIYLSQFCQSIHSSICPFIYPILFYLFMYQSFFHNSIYPTIYLSIYPSVSLSTHYLSLSLSLYHLPSIHQTNKQTKPPFYLVANSLIVHI